MILSQFTTAGGQVEPKCEFALCYNNLPIGLGQVLILLPELTELISKVRLFTSCHSERSEESLSIDRAHL